MTTNRTQPLVKDSVDALNIAVSNNLASLVFVALESCCGQFIVGGFAFH